MRTGGLSQRLQRSNNCLILPSVSQTGSGILQVVVGRLAADDLCSGARASRCAETSGRASSDIENRPDNSDTGRGARKASHVQVGPTERRSEDRPLDVDLSYICKRLRDWATAIGDRTRTGPRVRVP